MKYTASYIVVLTVIALMVMTALGVWVLTHTVQRAFVEMFTDADIAYYGKSERSSLIPAKNLSVTVAYPVPDSTVVVDIEQPGSIGMSALQSAFLTHLSDDGRTRVVVDSGVGPADDPDRIKVMFGLPDTTKGKRYSLLTDGGCRRRLYLLAPKRGYPSDAMGATEALVATDFEASMFEAICKTSSVYRDVTGKSSTSGSPSSMPMIRKVTHEERVRFLASEKDGGGRVAVMWASEDSAWIRDVSGLKLVVVPYEDASRDANLGQHRSPLTWPPDAIDVTRIFENAVVFKGKPAVQEGGGEEDTKKAPPQIVSFWAAPCFVCVASDSTFADVKHPHSVLLVKTAVRSDMDAALVSHYKLQGVQFTRAILEVVQDASNALSQKQDAMNDGRLQILEQFAVDKDVLELHPTQGVNVVKFVLTPERRRILTIAGRSVQGVKVRVGDRVTLSEQSRDEQNGTFIVTALTDSTATLEYPILLAADDPTVIKISVMDPSSPDLDVRVFASSEVLRGVRLGDMVAWVWGSPHSSGSQRRVSVGVVHIIDDRDGVYRLLVRMTPSEPPSAMRKYDEDKYHPLAVCAKNDGEFDFQVPNKEMCDRSSASLSLLDPDLADLRPFAKRDAWDHPCVRDTECPFFQRGVLPKDRERGGCLTSGYCEMPIGVKRVGYRHFDADASRAFIAEYIESSSASSASAVAFPLGGGIPPREEE